jgi:hypothetical protein
MRPTWRSRCGYGSSCTLAHAPTPCRVLLLCAVCCRCEQDLGFNAANMEVKVLIRQQVPEIAQVRTHCLCQSQAVICSCRTSQHGLRQPVVAAQGQPLPL